MIIYEHYAHHCKSTSFHSPYDDDLCLNFEVQSTYITTYFLKKIIY